MFPLILPQNIPPNNSSCAILEKRPVCTCHKVKRRARHSTLLFVDTHCYSFLYPNHPAIIESFEVWYNNNDIIYFTCKSVRKSFRFFADYLCPRERRLSMRKRTRHNIILTNILLVLLLLQNWVTGGLGSTTSSHPPLLCVLDRLAAAAK